MDQSLKQESVRMRSTIQSLISSTPMIRTMPTTVTRSMNLRRAKPKNHLRRCPRLCNRQCNRLSSFPKKYDGALDLSLFPPFIVSGQYYVAFFFSPQVQSQVIQETIVPKEPPPEFEFIADPPSISAFDLDVVKLTAQFVARNGRQFLTQLMQKEQRNYQFDFLRPQHSLFNYFTKLVEQYTKVTLLS